MLDKKSKEKDAAAGETPGTPCTCSSCDYAGISAIPRILALALLLVVGEYSRPHALLALPPVAVTLAYARSPSFLALAAGSSGDCGNRCPTPNTVTRGLFLNGNCASLASPLRPQSLPHARSRKQHLSTLFPVDSV